MKILELRFKNLNSLYGEWIIDFNDPAYRHNGIFALTGPTGAGKSTILDAICLALYGATPRLGKITKSGNEIMSRQAGECYAEVLFASQAGSFRCHWQQRRARKKADGNLQDQEHLIADADTGRPLETKKSLVPGIIEEKTGMDFDRFTRSILLAQGGFDTFLKADVEQKSRILEQITGTEIYSEISRRVHERQRDERETLNLLRAEISGIVVLEPGQEKEMQLDLATKQIKEIELTGKSAEIGKAIAWLTAVNGLKKEITSLTEEAADLQSEIEAFKPERGKLDRAMKAASLDRGYAMLTSLRKQQSDDQGALKIEEALLPGLKTSANRQAESLKTAEQQTLKAKEDLKASVPIIQKIRSLDQKLAEQDRAVAEGIESCTREAAKIDAENLARLKEQQRRKEAEKTLEHGEGYLNKHAGDEWLISGLAGIEEQLNSLLTRQEEIVLKEADLKDADTALAKATKNLEDRTRRCNICRRELETAVDNLQRGKESLNSLLGDRLLREYRKEKETLLREMAYLRKIGELEDYRAKLEDGRPCPLCGSKEHPFAAGNVPVPDEIEQNIEALTKLIIKAEHFDANNKKFEEAKAAASKNLHDSEKLETHALGDKKAAEKDLVALMDSLGKLRTGSDELKQTVSDKLQPLGITVIPETQVSSLLASLKSRLNAWQLQVKKKAEVEKQLSDLEGEVKRLDAVIATHRTVLADKQKHLETLKREQAVVSDERKNLYGDKKPDDEEGRLNKAVTEAEEVEKKARIVNSEQQEKLTSARVHVESLKKRIDKMGPELEKSEVEFAAALALAGFSDEKMFCEARLTTELQQTLSAKAKELDDGQIDLKARQKDREARLATEKSKKVTDKTLEELEPESRTYEVSLKQLRESIAGLRHRLGENVAAKERIKARQSAIETQKKECCRWEKLHALIGSADGKKYRNFAQGLTFELMVSHANRQLVKMTDRYLLIRDNEQPLELNVIDNYQAGEIRSTRNLSGGESFIVSLTLALGLSKMASRKVRVDSLFLDEGFGTLDEETLDTALETLSGLQQDNKLIGIISHVSALKERISTQITVLPVSGGRSTLAGPGCSRAGHRADG